MKIPTICRYCGGKIIKSTTRALYPKGSEPIYLCVNCNAYVSERLAEDHIRTWSNEGDLVLAPFDKDGTVAKIAPLLERRWLSLQNAADCDGLRDNAG